MRTLHIGDDYKRLYFTNFDKRSDDEEYEEIMAVLKSANCQILNKTIGPDCDLINCMFGYIEFQVIHTIDGEGTFIYCESRSGMKEIESLFMN